MTVRMAVVIPATAGREDNLELAVLALRRSEVYPPPPIVVVDDGGMLGLSDDQALRAGIDVVRVPKHQPGMEQPRNVGVRWALEKVAATHVWFVDSDVMINPSATAHLLAALEHDPNRILVAPYDWLPPGIRPGPDSWGDFWTRVSGENNDPRWEMFDRSDPDRLYKDDLSAGLACFSGNLVWPTADFTRVGGFWSEIHHGRCEDGELGLRAVSMQVPISFVAAAYGVHLWHPINTALAIERNARDVPMLNARHPWVERGAVFLSDRDGGAFEVSCGCGRVVPTGGWWQHAASCGSTTMELPVA